MGNKCPRCEEGKMQVVGFHNLNEDGECQEILKCDECGFVEA
jgi:hypothetical protein